MATKVVEIRNSIEGKVERVELSREAAKHVVALIRPSLREADAGKTTVEAVSDKLVEAIRAERVRFNLDGVL